MSSLSKLSRLKWSLLFSGLTNFRFLLRLLLLFSDSSLVTLDAEQATLLLDAELILQLSAVVVTCSSFFCWNAENGKNWDLLIKFNIFVSLSLQLEQTKYVL